MLLPPRLQLLPLPAIMLLLPVPVTAPQRSLPAPVMPVQLLVPPTLALSAAEAADAAAVVPALR
jgi:hypothetical protein